MGITLLLIGLAVLLVGLLVYLLTQDEPGPMLGPGVFADHSGAVEFEVPQGWEVRHAEEVTRVVPVADGWPAFTVTLRTMEQLDLVVNWNCAVLQTRAPRVAHAVFGQDVTIRYAAVPCAQDNAVTQAYGRVDVVLPDGSGHNRLLYFTPVDGSRWLVVRSESYPPEAPPALVEAMSQVITTVRLASSS